MVGAAIVVHGVDVVIGGVNVGDGVNPPGVTVTQGQPKQGSNAPQSWRTSPVGHGWFSKQAPHAAAKQNGRMVGHGKQRSAQYGVPVGAHVGVGVGVPGVVGGVGLGVTVNARTRGANAIRHKPITTADL